MTVLRMLLAVAGLLAIMGIAVFVRLGRGVALCVQWAGRLAERRPRHTLVQRPIPLQRPWDA